MENRQELTVTVETSGNLAENDYKNEIFTRLARWQIPCATKQLIQDAVRTCRSRLELVSRIPSLCPEEAAAQGEMIEILSSAE